jgi:hypothetical protein
LSLFAIFSVTKACFCAFLKLSSQICTKRNLKGKIMANILKSILVLIAVTLCIALLAGHSTGPTVIAQTQQAEKAEEPHQDKCVLVEAFVIEVQLSELYEQGVSPIGQKPNSVSVKNILKCLDSSAMAQVTTGIKVTVPSGHHGEAKIKETIQQIPFSNSRNVPGPVRYLKYEIGKTFAATASIKSSSEILMSFDFNESTYRNIPSNDDTPPNPINREWSGTVSLNAGQPEIAGATQNEETAVFLILCADIMGR